MTDEGTPIGPGFFIFFQDEEITGTNANYKPYKHDEDQEILVIIMAFLGIEHDA